MTDTSTAARGRLISGADIARIKSAHKNASPKPNDNPAWANCHRDLGMALKYITQLHKAMNLVIPVCGSLHHAPNLYHKLDEDCKAERLYRLLTKEINGHD